MLQRHKQTGDRVKVDVLGEDSFKLRPALNAGRKGEVGHSKETKRKLKFNRVDLQRQQ